MFWLAAGLLALVVAALLVASALQRADTGADDDSHATRIHEDQLREVERDAARGALSADEAARLRAEVARRLLSGPRDDIAPARGPATWAAALALLVVVGGSVGLYRHLGAPGYPDLPLADRIARAAALRDARPSQEAAEAAAPKPAAVPVDPSFQALIDQLRAKVADRPDDLQGHVLLVENEARLGNAAAAARAQAQVIRIKGQYVAPEDHVLLARLMIEAADGAISPQAEAALGAALMLNPDSDEALFLMGLSQMRIGRPDLGFQAWQRLVATAPGGSPWLIEALPRMPELAAVAGVDYTPPADLTIPTAADIDGMVEGLAERLATDGGSAEEWARLITSLGTLGQTDRARAILAEAEAVFAGRDADLATIRTAAGAAGIAE